LGIAIWQYSPSLSSGIVTRGYSEPLDGLERAQIEIDFSAGSVTIGSLPLGSLNFVEVDSKVRNNRDTINADFHQQDGEGELYLSTVNQRSWGGDGIGWEVRFTKSIPLVINIKSAASSMELDLSGLQATKLRLDVDAGNYIVTTPSKAGTSNIEIEANAANIEVTIPDGVAAKIQVDTNLSVLDVDENRFPQQGGYYMSQDFVSAENRVELEIDCDVGRVQVK